MGNRLITLLVVALSLLVASVPVMAHHGDASFGSGDPVTVKGTVVEWLWANPHCLLRFDVKGDDGQVQHWVGETQSPFTIKNQGWNGFMFKPGDQVTVTIRTIKNRQFIGPIAGVVLADGRVFKGASSPARSAAE
jgi:hypothetical protein